MSLRVNVTWWGRCNSHTVYKSASWQYSQQKTLYTSLY